MAVDADQVASGLASAWELLVTAGPDGWSRRECGVIAAVSGAPVATLNGVWPEQVALDVAAVAALLDEVASSGLPYCLQLRPGSDEGLVSMAAARGMVKEEELPLMAYEGDGTLDDSTHVDGLRIRQLAPAEAALHATIAARGFDAPEEIFLQLMVPAVLGLLGLRCYVGEIDGEPVTTGLGATLGPCVGIFNIATPPEHRGRGFGAAVTARAVADGLANGAQWAFLQSSPAGYGIYRRLGFRTVERWACWTASARAARVLARGQSPEPSTHRPRRSASHGGSSMGGSGSATAPRSSSARVNESGSSPQPLGSPIMTSKSSAPSGPAAKGPKAAPSGSSMWVPAGHTRSPQRISPWRTITTCGL